MSPARFPLLVTLFSRRFFENDLLAPDIDLRPTAIWLLAALATPPVLWTAKSIVPFGLMVVHGYEVMEVASWFDKSLLMMLAMVNAGIVTVLSWEALLVDRRDALVLGSLPVSPRLVVAAKAVALARLFAVVIAINLPAVVILSLAVYSHFGVGMVVRALVAHLVAASAASLATCIGLTAALVAVTSLFEGRWLRLMTVVVQMAVLGVLAGLLFGIQWTPTLMAAARRGDMSMGWVAWWPPGWFLGLYQGLFGAAAGHGVFTELADRALVTIAAAVIAGIPLTLWLWRRALRLLVSAAPEPSAGRMWSLAHHLPRCLARPAVDRAYLQFFLTVLWRSPRHRLALLTAGGLSAAITLQGVLVLASRTTPVRWLTEFAVPLLALLCLTAVLRWLLLLPAELPASWVIGLSSPAPGRLIRRVVGRLLLLMAGLPAAMLAFTLSWWQGDLGSAGAHALLVAGIALVLVEYALTKVTFMPFATEYLPGRSNLKARWPIHALVLLIAVPTAAELERFLVATPSTPFVVAIAGLLGSAGFAILRRRSRFDVVTADPGSGLDWTPVQLRLAGM